MMSKVLSLACLTIPTLTLLAPAVEPTTRPAPAATRPATQPADAIEDDVFEAVFRYQFEHNLSMQKDKAAVYYLSLQVREKSDPDKAFMKRFAGHQPPVRTASERKAAGANPGLIFTIETIKWMAGKAEVHGGFYEGVDDAAGSAYTVEKVDGKWKVIAEKPEWIT